MNQPYYETFHEISSIGIYLSYHTTPGGYLPLHWHEELEILFPLNGDAVITIEGKRYKLPKKQLMVIDSSKVHSSYSSSTAYMFICIHISRQLLQKYIPDIDSYQVTCYPGEIPPECLPAYLKICKKMEDLTRLYIENPFASLMESEGIILQILAQIMRYFSANTVPQISDASKLTMERLRNVITYVEKHFREPISLQDISDYLGLGKEYFCRFFKKNMGISFLQYINEVRIAHVYHDLMRTDIPILELAEKNGFTNQKLFNRTFKKIYGCTPSSVRKNAV